MGERDTGVGCEERGPRGTEGWDRRMKKGDRPCPDKECGNMGANPPGNIRNSKQWGTTIGKFKERAYPGGEPM